MADEHIEALRASVARLHDLVIEMDEADLTRPAYPSEWSIADVLSHIGSGAVIMKRRLDDTLAGVDTPAEFAPGVWDAWNAKDPVAKRGDALTADAELLARIDAVTSEQRRTFASAMGPMTLDFAAFVGMRLNEHALHTWDIEVVDNPAATISQIRRWTGRRQPRADHPIHGQADWRDAHDHRRHDTPGSHLPDRAHA